MVQKQGFFHFLRFNLSLGLDRNRSLPLRGMRCGLLARRWLAPNFLTLLSMNKLQALVALAALFSSPAAIAADNDIFIFSDGSSIVVPSFRTYMATGYAPSEKNVAFLKGLKEKIVSPKLLAFDATRNNQNMLLCRVSFPVYGPNKTPFASLVEAAANMELVEAGLATPDAPRIQASLDEFDFSSFGVGRWNIDATLAADGKPPLIVSSVYEYPVSAGAVNACADVMNALPSGIEAFLLKLYSDPGFIEALR